MGYGPSVLVVGAGPVGLVLACELARRGIGVRLLDKLAQPTDESRAIVVHARSLEMMERIGAVDALRDSGIETRAATFHADGKVLARVELDTVDSPFPFSISTAQTETERVLTERLRELGVEIDRGVELVGLEQDEEGVTSTLRLADGSSETVRSAYVAGTDGSHSTVRGLVGTRLEGSFEGERFLLADVEADYDLDRGSMHMFFVSDHGPLLAFPMRGERLRLIAQLDGDVDAQAGPTLADVQRATDRRAPGFALRSGHWLTIFEIHHAQVPRYRHGRVFLAGDAAHVHSPAGAQGMNTGMQDAFNLGWKLALAVEARATEALLDSYHAERHPVAARVIEQTTRMTTVATLPHALQRTLRNYAVRLATALAPIRHRLADMTEETDIAYRESPIVALFDGAGPPPGDAAPDVAAVSLHRVLADGAGHTAMWVVPPGGFVPAPASGVRNVLVGASDDRFDATVPDSEGAVARRYGMADEGGLVVVRPDGYIGLRAALADAGVIDEYLAALVR